MSSAQPKVNVMFTFAVANSDGTPFHTTQLSYPGLSYASLTQMEAILVQAVSALQKLGEAQATKAG